MPITKPEPVRGNPKLVEIATAEYATCGRRSSDDAVVCWVHVQEPQPVELIGASTAR